MPFVPDAPTTEKRGFVPDVVAPQTREELIAQIPGAVRPPEPEQDVGGQYFNALPKMLQPVARVGVGAGETAASIVSSIPAMVKSGIQMLPGTGQRPPGDFMQRAASDTYAPKTETGKNILSGVGKVAENLQALGPEFGGYGSLLKNLSKASPAAIQALIDADTVGMSGGKVGQALKAASSAITPSISKETAEIASKAQKMGFSIPPDMLTDKNLLKVFGKASREIPLSGSVTDANRAAFNRAIIGTFGGDVKADKITPQVFADAMKKSGTQIGEASKYPVKVGDFTASLAEHATDLSKETPDVAAAIQGTLKDIASKVKDGSIDGQSFRKLRTELGAQMRSTTNGDLKRYLGQIDDAMIDAIGKNLNGKELEAFNTARGHYAAGKQVESLVAKAAVKGSGNMSPAAYANAITNNTGRKTQVAMGRGGQPVDIAAIGSKFLTEPGSSNTAEKGLAYSALGGSGLAGGLPAAGSAYTIANIYNRLGPKLSKAIIQKSLGKDVAP